MAITESTYALEFLLSEAPGARSRDAGVLLSGQSVVAGRVLGQLLGENLIEAATIHQVGEGIVMRHLLQLHPRLIQLAEQGVDPTQVVLLALQLLVGHRGADAGADDQQRNDRDGQPQLHAVLGVG